MQRSNSEFQSQAKPEYCKPSTNLKIQKQSRYKLRTPKSIQVEIQAKPLSNKLKPSHSQTIASQAVPKPSHSQSSTKIFQVSSPTHERSTYHCSKLFHESSNSSYFSKPTLFSFIDYMAEFLK
jgi:hypothetical protein